MKHLDLSFFCQWSVKHEAWSGGRLPAACLLLLLTACGSLLTPAFSQVPVTVTRATVRSGGTISLPGYSGAVTVNWQVGANMSYSGGSVSPGSDGNYWTSVSGGAFGSPATVWAGSSASINVSVSPTAVIATNAPSVFTNSVMGSAIYTGGGYSRNASLGQSYEITIIEEGTVGGGAATPTATLTGAADSLESVSRKNVSADPRRLMTFQLRATTNALLRTLAVSLSNTSTNGINAFSEVRLYRDLDGGQEWDSGDPPLAEAAPSGSFVVFDGLAETLTSTNKTFFVAAAFQPTNQTQNSFLSASLRGQNIVVTLAGTNTVIETTGGPVLGKQYAFLDTTVEEDAFAATSLSNQIDSAVSGATNTLTATFNDTLATVSNSLRGLSTVTGQSRVEKTDFLKTVLPATAAGAASIGAAFTSDALTQGALSLEFSPPQEP